MDKYSFIELKASFSILISPLYRFKACIAAVYTLANVDIYGSAEYSTCCILLGSLGSLFSFYIFSILKEIKDLKQIKDKINR